MRSLLLVMLFCMFTLPRSSSQSVVWQRILGADRKYAAASMMSPCNATILILTYDGIIFQSQDNGATWTKASITLYNKGFPNYSLVKSVDGTIFAGSPSGMFRSTDNGMSWLKVSDVAWSLSVDSTGRIYKADGSSGVASSTDRGNTWQATVYLDMATLAPVTLMEVLYNQNILAQTGLGKILSSSDHGITWKTISNAELQPRVLAVSKPVSGSSFLSTGSLVYRASHTDSSWTLVHGFPNRVLSFGSNLLNQVFAVTDGDVFQSTDLGNTWSSRSTGLDTIGLVTICTSPNGTMFVGTTAGSVFKSTSLATQVSVQMFDHPDALLVGNYPNPFNSSSWIEFTLPFHSHTTLTLFDALGRKIQILFEGIQEAGTHRILIHGSRLSSGTYYYKLNAGDYSQAKRAILIK